MSKGARHVVWIAFGLIVGCLCLGIVPARAITSESIVADNDTYVYEGAPNENYNAALDAGARVSFGVMGDGYQDLAYFHFPITPNPAEFMSATVVLFYDWADANFTANVFYVPDSAWAEDTMTWNTQHYPGQLMGTVPVNATDGMALNITIDVSYWVSASSGGFSICLGAADVHAIGSARVITHEASGSGSLDDYVPVLLYTYAEVFNWTYVFIVVAIIVGVFVMAIIIKKRKDVRPASVNATSAVTQDNGAETVYIQALDANRHLITVQGVLVEQKEHSLTLQHSNGGQHTYETAYNLADLRYGNSYRVFAYQRPGIDEHERLFRLPEICHPDGNPETPFDADRYAVEELADWQTADVAATARSGASDLLKAEETLKGQVLDTIRQLQAAGKVGAEYVQDVGRALGIGSPTPAAPAPAVPEPATVGVVNRAPVRLSRRALPVRSSVISSTPVNQVSTGVPPAPAEIPSERVISTRTGKRGKVKLDKKKKKAPPSSGLLSRGEKKKLQKKMGWLNP